MNKYCAPTVAIFGFFLLLFGVIFALYVIPLMENIFYGEGDLINGTKIWDGFLKPHFPRQFKAYLFNVTNPEAVQNGAKPILTEIGPYVYDVQITRRIQNVNENANTIEYFKTTLYSFNYTQSGGRTEDDVLTVINTPLVGITQAIKFHIRRQPDGIANGTFFGIENVFIRAKIKELLFGGIKISCSNQSLAVICSYATWSTGSQFFRPSGDDLIFSIFHHRNGTEIGPYAMSIGKGKIPRGDIVSYKARKSLNVWKKQCDLINGTNLDLFQTLPLIAPRLDIFLHELCRSMFLVFDRDEETFGIPCYTYINNQEPFDASKANACFCRRSNCNRKGTMNLNGCTKFPLVVSYPHFYLGDPVFKKYVQGLAAEKKSHESLVSLEPRSGVPLRIAIRFQFNVRLEKIKNLDFTSNVSEGLFPILWTEEGLCVSQDIIDYFLTKMYYRNMLHIGKYSMVLIGILIMLSSVGLLCCKPKTTVKEKDQSFVVILNNNDKSVKVNPSLYPQTVNKNVSDGFTTRRQLQILNRY